MDQPIKEAPLFSQQDIVLMGILVALRPRHDAVITVIQWHIFRIGAFQSDITTFYNEHEPGKISTSIEHFSDGKSSPSQCFERKDPSSTGADSSVQLWQLAWSQRARPGAQILGCGRGVYRVYPPMFMAILMVMMVMVMMMMMMMRMSHDVT